MYLTDHASLSIARLMLLVSLGWLLVACESTPSTSSPGSASNPATQQPSSTGQIITLTRDAAGQPVIADAPASQQAVERSQLEAQRLQQALQKMPRAGEPPAATQSAATQTTTSPSTDVQVRWLETKRPRPMPTPSATTTLSAVDPDTTTGDSDDTLKVKANSTFATVDTASTTSPPPPVAVHDRQVLLEQLRAVLRQGDEPALRRAITAAGLSLADPSRPLSPADLEGLTAAQRDLVMRYHQVIVQLGMQLAGKESNLNRADVETLLQGLLPPQPLKIINLQLCRRVRSFGVYEPFADTVFQAGRAHRAIVYVEVDHFRSSNATSASGQSVFQVKLQQEISIINQADGLEVWKSAPANIVDESRQQRRDFFVVQMIDIPANLGVGRYQLRARLTDTQAQTVDEAVLPLTLVADPALLRASPPR